MWTIEVLAKRHRRESFRCGVPSLDDWLKTKATPWSRKDLSRVFVALQGASPTVLGYYTLSSHRVQYEALSEESRQGLPQINVPSVLLGRLAVDHSVAGKGLGRFLLFDAMKNALRVADLVGTSVFEVEALDDRAHGFYLRCGLISLLDDQNHLFLPIKQIRALGLDDE